MKQPDPIMFALQRLTSNLSKIDRNHHILNSERQENDIEHSFTVTLLCWYIYDKLDLDLDREKVLTYALVHDFAEVYAGDVNTYASKEAREQKVVREAEAIARLSSELKPFKSMVKALNDYELKCDDESIFVWTVDKMQALILGDLDNWRPYKKINISYDTFLHKHHEQLSACSPHCKKIFQTLFEYCKTTYYDQPTSKPS